MYQRIRTFLRNVALVFACMLTFAMAFVMLTACSDEHVHTLTHVDAVNATCTESGTVEHWNCSECGKNFSDEEGTEEIGNITIAALGHDFGEYVVEKAATCEQEGVEVSTCSRCQEEQTRTIAALGHDWDEGVVTKEATCTGTGVRTYTCSRCQETKTESIAALGHNWNSGTVTVEPTCTQTGTRVVSCTRCGETDTVTVAALGHSWDEGVVTTEATCTEDGSRTRTCTSCDETKEEVIPALDHDWGEGVVTTQPTCTEEGERTYTCARCAETKTEVIAATGHTPGEAVKENVNATSCMAPGSYDSVVYCTVCKEELSRETITVEQLGHSWGEGVVTTQPTCTEEGVRTYTCARCQETKTEPIAATGHAISETWTATETEHYKTCANDASEQLEKAAHEFVWVVDQEATCAQEGSRHQECSVCGYEKVGSTEVIEKTEHQYVLDTGLTDYSECEGGEKVYTCEQCFDEKAEELKGKGHNYVNGVCTVCGDAQPTNIFTVSSVSGSRGDTVTVTITLSGVVKNAGFVIDFNYDTSALRYRGYTAGNTGHGLAVNEKFNDGNTIRVVADNAVNCTSDATVVTFTFLVITEEAGESDLSLTVDQIREVWKDNSIQPTGSNVVNGKLTVN